MRSHVIAARNYIEMALTGYKTPGQAAFDAKRLIEA
jgi:hypothetical protein